MCWRFSVSPRPLDFPCTLFFIALPFGAPPVLLGFLLPRPPAGGFLVPPSLSTWCEDKNSVRFKRHKQAWAEHGFSIWLPFSLSLFFWPLRHDIALRPRLLTKDQLFLPNVWPFFLFFVPLENLMFPKEAFSSTIDLPLPGAVFAEPLQLCFPSTAYADFRGPPPSAASRPTLQFSFGASVSRSLGPSPSSPHRPPWWPVPRATSRFLRLLGTSPDNFLPPLIKTESFYQTLVLRYPLRQSQLVSLASLLFRVRGCPPRWLGPASRRLSQRAGRPPPHPFLNNFLLTVPPVP